MKQGTRIIIIFIGCCLSLAATKPAVADRQNTVSGSLSLRQGYDSNVYRAPTGETEEWTTALIPSISIDSKGRYDSLNLTYSPSYKYNYRLDEGSFEHHLALAAARALSDRMKLSVHDSFQRSDDATLSRYRTQDTSNQVNLSENLPRTKYWANFVNINNAWQYAQNSSLTLGYTHSVYRTNGPAQDFQRHEPSIAIIQAINQQWMVSAGYTFTKGNFEQSDDLKQHNAKARLTYQLSPHKAIYGQGQYTKTNYSGASIYSGARIDYSTSTGLLGFSQQIDPNTALDIAAGYAVTRRDSGSDESGFSSSLSLTHNFEKGVFALTGGSGYADQSFNGEKDGLDKFWKAQSTLTYQLTERLSSAIYALYRNDKYVEQVPERKDDSYEAGGSLNWSFARWYTAAIRYVFHKLDSSRPGYSYDDHQLYLTLSAAKDLWRW